LVSVFDVGLVSDRPYLVMQLVDGDSLACRLLDGPLPVEDTMRIGAVLADALAHAHRRGVVHRDVKPSNILLDAENMPYLTDFGIALLSGSTRLTSADEIIGTPAYLAPEQILGEPIGPPADVYALGLVLLECVTGEMEYSGGTRLEAALARLHRPPRVPATLPDELADLLRAMTDKEPCRRPTAEECAQRLRGVPLVVERHRWRVAVAAATAVAAVGGGVLLAVDLPSPSSDPPTAPVAAEQQTTTPEHTTPSTAGPTRSPRVTVDDRVITAPASVRQPAAPHTTSAARPPTQATKPPATQPATGVAKGKTNKGKSANGNSGSGHGRGEH
jgi:serine/threonine protein kinase